MNFEIKLYEDTQKVGFYTVFVDDAQVSETDQFLTRFMDKEEFREDLATIRAEIKNMGKFGARPERFRVEDDCGAIPLQKKAAPGGVIKVLRLYCIRCSSETVILCGGGLKTTKNVQDSPDAYFHFRRAKQFEKLYRSKLLDKEITNDGKYLNGDLVFIDYYFN